jgi:hypothetical protein
MKPWAFRTSTGVLAIVVCLLTAGCVWFAPLHTSHEPISSIKVADFEFVKAGQPTRSDAEAKLGAPEIYCEDLRVAVYPLEKLRRHKVKLLFFLIPVGWFEDYPGFEVACIEFDEHDRAQRYGTYTGYLGLSSGDLRFYAKEWMETRDGKKPAD